VELASGNAQIAVFDSVVPKVFDHEPVEDAAGVDR
jgi:hypothetical protein